MLRSEAVMRGIMETREDMARFAFMNCATVVWVKDEFAGGQESSAQTAVDSKQDLVRAAIMERRFR